MWMFIIETGTDCRHIQTLTFKRLWVLYVPAALRLKSYCAFCPQTVF